MPEPPSTSRGDRHEGLEGRYSAAFGTRGAPKEEAPPAKEREAFWGRIAVLLLGVSWPPTALGLCQRLCQAPLHHVKSVSPLSEGASLSAASLILNFYWYLQLCLRPCCKC